MEETRNEEKADNTCSMHGYEPYDGNTMFCSDIRSSL